LRGKILKNVSWLMLLQGFNYLMPLLLIPYLVRVLGPRNFGILAFAQALIQYFVRLTDYGFNYSASRKIAVHRSDSEAVGRIAGAVMVIKALLLLASMVVVAAIVALVPLFREHWLLYLACFGSVVGFVLFPTWLFQGIEKMQYIAICNAAPRSLAVIAIFLLVRRSDQVTLVASLQSAGLVLAGLAAWWPANRGSRLVKVRWPTLREVRAEATEGWHMFVSMAAVSMYLNTNAFVLGFVAGPEAVGYFTAASKIVAAIQNLLDPFSQAIYPHISGLVAKSREEALQFLRTALRPLAGFAALSSLLLFLGAPILVRVGLGSKFIPATDVLRWLAPIPLIVMLSNIFGIQTMLPFGHDRAFSRILIGAGVLNVVLVLPLAHLFAAPGAAVSLLITEIFVTLVTAMFLRRDGLALWSAQAA
jgi:PST family polysaccharide transporter